MMIDLSLENPRRSGETLQNTIASQLRERILAGHLVAGSRLPAARELAQALGVARVTVDAALGRLEAEGYLLRRIGAGTFVRQDVTPAAPTTARPAPASPPLSARGQVTLASTACRDQVGRIPFNAGTPDLRAFPYALWQRLIAQHLRRHGAELSDYGDPQGYAPLRKAIAAWLNQSRGVRCAPEQVLVLTSSQQAIQLAATLLLDPGDAAVIENPGYLGARTALLAAGAALQPVGVDAAGADPAGLPGDARPRLIYLTPAHQYPLGHALTLPRRLAWLAYARATDAWIVEDDYDGEFQYEHQPLPALQSLDRDGRVIYVGTFSKTLLPSLRLAYMVLPGELAATFATARHAYDGHCAQLMQAVAADFLAHGHFATHLRHMRQLYRCRRDVLLECLRPLETLLTPLATATGLQFAVTMSSDCAALASRARLDHGMALRSLKTFYLGPPRQSGWLLGYAALDNQAIRDAACVLVASLREHAGRKQPTFVAPMP